jgi:sugar phosphate isomerase/epimerase
VILCASSLRPPGPSGPSALIQLAADAGCDGLMLDGGCLLRQVPLLGTAARQAKLTMPVLLAPVPEERPSLHRRLPSLAGDRDERAAAVELVVRAMQVSRDAGTRTVVLDFGRLPVGGEEADLRRHFARRELDEGEPGGLLLAGVLGERRRRAEEWTDHCRLALEALLRYAVPMDVRLAILPAATPWQVPTPRETTELIRDFSGAPVGSVFSPARLAVLSALGLGVTAERRAALRETAFVVEVADAVGVDHPLPLGLGELDPAELRGFAEGVPLVLGGTPDTSPAELRAAKKLIVGS